MNKNHSKSSAPIEKPLLPTTRDFFNALFPTGFEGHYLELIRDTGNRLCSSVNETLEVCSDYSEFGLTLEGGPHERQHWLGLVPAICLLIDVDVCDKLKEGDSPIRPSILASTGEPKEYEACWLLDELFSVCPNNLYIVGCTSRGLAIELGVDECELDRVCLDLMTVPDGLDLVEFDPDTRFDIQELHQRVHRLNPTVP